MLNALMLRWIRLRPVKIKPLFLIPDSRWRCEAVQGVEVGAAGVGSGVGVFALAHRAFQLADRFVLVLIQPGLHVSKGLADHARPALQDGAGHVGDIGPGEQHF